MRRSSSAAADAAAAMAALVVLVGLACATVVAASRAVPRYQLTANGRRPIPVMIIGDSYTTGTDQGGRGPSNWTVLMRQRLADWGIPIDLAVAAEGRAGYVVKGDHGSVFEDLTARIVTPAAKLVVFFGSLNDRDVDPEVLTVRSRATLARARRLAPSATMLVIGPPWPNADVPGSLLRNRDALRAVAHTARATFVDPIAERWLADQPELIGSDAVHPNDAGHRYLADKIAPLIRDCVTS